MEYSKTRIINKEIPDNDPIGLLDRINVTRNLTVKGVDVHVDIKHPYTGDISIDLIGPNGQRKTLLSPSRVPGTNILKHFNGDMMAPYIGQKCKGEWTLNVVDAGAKDMGQLITWTLTLECANSKTSEVFIDDDNNLKSKHTCHQDGTITELDASIDIEHSHIGDLTCTLVSPGGKEVLLHNKTGGSESNLTKTYGKDILASFIGEQAKGVWQLKVEDGLKGDAGRLKSWKLSIKTTTKPAISNEKDDLTKIEGIGPKIKGLMWDAGINSFAQLAQADSAYLKTILVEAGPRFKMHDPTSWPKQSKLAADGKWDELKQLQDVLDGGK